jgi:hypothetical protein
MNDSCVERYKGQIVLAAVQAVNLALGLRP